VWSGTAIANANLANSALTIGTTNVALGATSLSLAGLSTVTSTNFVGGLTGNASTATKLAATKNINGVAFDGSADITVAANSNTLTGTTLASNVVSSSLTGVGTITSGVWSATTIDVAHGGTGITSLTTGYIPYGNGTSAFGGTANLFWDNTNSRLGIGTSTPTTKLEVNGSFKASGLTYPTSDGTTGQYLKTDGSGNIGFTSNVNLPQFTTTARDAASLGLGTLLYNTSAGTIQSKIVDANGVATNSFGPTSGTPGVYQAGWSSSTQQNLFFESFKATSAVSAKSVSLNIYVPSGTSRVFVRLFDDSNPVNGLTNEVASGYADVTSTSSSNIQTINFTTPFNTTLNSVYTALVYSASQANQFYFGTFGSDVYTDGSYSSNSITSGNLTTISSSVSGISANTWSGSDLYIALNYGVTATKWVDLLNTVDLTANVTGTLPITNGGTGATTASGVRTNIGLSNVENTSLSTWAGTTNITTLGTISSGTWNGSVITPAYGGTGLTSLGIGIASFLATPTSSNLAATLSDETGSGSLVFATSPTLVTPNIGTASGTSLSLTGGVSAGTSTLTSLSVSTNETIGGTLGVTGASTLTGNTSIGGALGVTGATSLSTLTTSGTATLTSLSVSTNETIGGTLGVTGASTLTGNTSIGGTLGVTGATSLSTLTTSGTATLTSLSVSTNETIGGTLGVTGASTLTGNTSIGGTLGVTGATTMSSTSAHGGAATFSSTVNVTGATSLTSLTASGNATFTSNVAITSGAGTGKVLTSDANGVATWQTGVNVLTTKTSNYTLTLNDNYVIMGTAAANGLTFTLPTAIGCAGKEFTIKNVSAYSVAIATFSATQYIIQDNSTATTNTANIGIEPSNNWIRVISDGANWIAFRGLF
jgi:hypothetical protein